MGTPRDSHATTHVAHTLRTSIVTHVAFAEITTRHVTSRCTFHTLRLTSQRQVHVIDVDVPEVLSTKLTLNVASPTSFRAVHWYWPKWRDSTSRNVRFLSLSP